MGQLEQFIHARLAGPCPACCWCGPLWPMCSSKPSTPSSTAIGRLARLLIVLIADDCRGSQLPLLYLSLFLQAAPQSRYYDLLNGVARTAMGGLDRFLPGGRRAARRQAAVDKRPSGCWRYSAPTKPV